MSPPETGFGSPPTPGTLLVDFDGTISQNDVGNLVLDRLSSGAARTVVDSWKQGAISSRECLIRECALSRGTPESVRELALAQPVDAGFDAFARRAMEGGWRLRVVSDGLDLYIRVVLQREGWGGIPVYANRVRFVGDRLLPSFPHAGSGCGSCGNCKRGSVEAARDREPVYFVGNGLSDRCGAHAADRVFAKDDLARYCRETGLEFTPYTAFSDLTACLFGTPAAPTATTGESMREEK